MHLNRNTLTPYKEVRCSFKPAAKTLQPVSQDSNITVYTSLVLTTLRVFLLLSSCDFTACGLLSSWEAGARTHKPDSISDWEIWDLYQFSWSFFILLWLVTAFPKFGFWLFVEAHQVSKQIKHYSPSTAAGVSVQLFMWMRFYFCVYQQYYNILHRN